MKFNGQNSEDCEMQAVWLLLDAELRTFGFFVGFAQFWLGIDKTNPDLDEFGFSIKYLVLKTI